MLISIQEETFDIFWLDSIPTEEDIPLIQAIFKEDAEKGGKGFQYARQLGKFALACTREEAQANYGKKGGS